MKEGEPVELHAMLDEYKWLALNLLILLVPLAGSFVGLLALGRVRKAWLKTLLGVIAIALGAFALLYGSLWHALWSDGQVMLKQKLEWIESKKPNLVILTTWPKWDYRKYKYPGAVGYTFGVGPTSEVASADMHLSGHDLIIPGGYKKPSDLRNGVQTWRTDPVTIENDQGGEYLVRSRKGVMFYVQLEGSEGTTAGLLRWLSFRPATD